MAFHTLGNAHDAEDAVQEAGLLLMAQRAEVTDERRCIYSLVRRACKDLARARLQQKRDVRMTRYLMESDFERDRVPSAEREALARIELAHLSTSAPPVVLCQAAGWGLGEMAAATGRTTDSIRMSIAWWRRGASMQGREG